MPHPCATPTVDHGLSVWVDGCQGYCQCALMGFMLIAGQLVSSCGICENEIFSNEILASSIMAGDFQQKRQRSLESQL